MWEIKLSEWYSSVSNACDASIAVRDWTSYVASFTKFVGWMVAWGMYSNSVVVKNVECKSWEGICSVLLADISKCRLYPDWPNVDKYEVSSAKSFDFMIMSLLFDREIYSVKVGCICKFSDSGVAVSCTDLISNDWGSVIVLNW